MAWTDWRFLSVLFISQGDRSVGRSSPSNHADVCVNRPGFAYGSFLEREKVIFVPKASDRSLKIAVGDRRAHRLSVPERLSSSG